MNVNPRNGGTMPTPSHNSTSVATRLLTLHEVMQMTALSRSSI